MTVSEVQILSEVAEFAQASDRQITFAGFTFQQFRFRHFDGLQNRCPPCLVLVDADRQIDLVRIRVVSERVHKTKNRVRTCRLNRIKHWNSV